MPPTHQHDNIFINRVELYASSYTRVAFVMQTHPLIVIPKLPHAGLKQEEPIKRNTYLGHLGAKGQSIIFIQPTRLSVDGLNPIRVFFTGAIRIRRRER